MGPKKNKQEKQDVIKRNGDNNLHPNIANIPSDHQRMQYGAVLHLQFRTKGVSHYTHV